MNPQAPSPRLADSLSPDAAREHLSALADGEADAQCVQLACSAWRDDAEARRTWHAYQLIGDVLRSGELASKPSHDAAFLAGVRARLEQEPVVLAPAPLAAAGAHSKAGGRPAYQRWAAPAAIAAGFVAVAGVLVVTRMNPPEASVPRAVMASGSPVVRTMPSGAAMLRDAQLDDYIDAHQAVRRGGAVVLPGSALRSVELVVPAGNQP